MGDFWRVKVTGRFCKTISCTKLFFLSWEKNALPACNANDDSISCAVRLFSTICKEKSFRQNTGSFLLYSCLLLETWDQSFFLGLFHLTFTTKKTLQYQECFGLNAMQWPRKHRERILGIGLVWNLKWKEERTVVFSSHWHSQGINLCKVKENKMGFTVFSFSCISPWEQIRKLRH